MFGIYLHYPFCVHKCFYCDFYSVENLKLREPFVENLITEIDLRFKSMSNNLIKADTLFFGGGTPSLMKPKHLEQILIKLHENINFDTNSELTLECNPGTVDVKYMSDFKSLGINRISFGVQSFNESELKFLERIHTPKQVYKAFEIARNAGFDNINIDLMFALPDQTMDSWNYSINEALSLEPDHISSYSLIYEPGTPLYTDYEKGKIKVIEEDLDTDLYFNAVNRFRDKGYEQYEVSNFHKNGKKCRHNLKYWHGEEYLAFGPSAHGYVAGERYWNFRSNEEYEKHLTNSVLPIEGSEILSKKEILLEKLFLELRADGLNINKINEDYKFNFLELTGKELKIFEEQGLLNIVDNLVRLTAKGYFLGDNITLALSEKLEDLKFD